MHYGAKGVLGNHFFVKDTFVTQKLCLLILLNGFLTQWRCQKKIFFRRQKLVEVATGSLESSRRGAKWLKRGPYNDRKIADAAEEYLVKKRNGLIQEMGNT